MTTPDELSHTRRTAIIVAIIGFVGLLVAALISVAWRTGHGHAESSETKIQFVGRVETDNGAPISGAKVLATQDQRVGESIRTDDNGQFTLKLSPETSALTLNVDSDGYFPARIFANVHRTGVEEIYLHKLPPSSQEQSPITPKTPHRAGDTKQQAPRSGIVKSPEIQPPLSSPLGNTVLPPVNNGIINNGTNTGVLNNCAAGVVDCNQTVNIDTKVLPQVRMTQNALTRASDDPGQGNPLLGPGVKVDLRVNRSFDDPAFLIVCNVPCIITNPMQGRQSGTYFISTSTQIVAHLGTNDSTHHKIAFADRVPMGGHIFFEVHSRNAVAASVLSVAPIKLNEQ